MHSILGKRSVRIGLAVVLPGSVLAAAYFILQQPTEQPADEGFQTAVVRRGNLTVFASGSGTLVAGQQVELGFGTNGPVAELYVQVADRVIEGDLLALQGDLEQLQAAVASDELALLQAQQELDALYEGADLATAEAQLTLANAQDAQADAQRKWQYQQEGYRGSTITIEAAEAELVLAKAQLDRAERTANSHADRPNDDPKRAQAYKDYAAAQTRHNQALASFNWYTGHPTETQQAQLDAEVALAEAELARAELAHEKLKDGPDPDEVVMAELRVANAQAALAVSQRNLDEAEIRAPFSGTVMAVYADVGESVSSPFITLANLNQSELEIFLDETDADKIDLGYEVEVIFDAIPDSIFFGQVVQVNPSLTVSGGVSTVQGRVRLEHEIAEGLLIGMNAAVDIIAGRAENVALVPVEALRELEPGEFAVFVVEDGQPKLRPVEVGLMDFSFAEVISGVNAGEVVTTGIVETG
jgi:multidrug efflux pump subunit AcrA (membrane-fusion protein)